MGVGGGKGLPSCLNNLPHVPQIWDHKNIIIIRDSSKNPRKPFGEWPVCSETHRRPIRRPKCLIRDQHKNIKISVLKYICLNSNWALQTCQSPMGVNRFVSFLSGMLIDNNNIFVNSPNYMTFPNVAWDVNNFFI